MRHLPVLSAVLFPWISKPDLSSESWPEHIVLKTSLSYHHSCCNIAIVCVILLHIYWNLSVCAAVAIVQWWTVDCEYWHVASVTVPSVRPRGPSSVQVSTALIWLISLMSLFLGGADKRLWPEHGATRRLHFARTGTQISWQLLTYMHIEHTLPHIRTASLPCQKAGTHTDTWNKYDDTLTFESNDCYS